MEELRLRLHQDRIIPRVRLASPNNIVELRVPFRSSRECAIVRGRPPTAPEGRLFCRRFEQDFELPFPYYGETLETLAARALELLLKPPPRPNVERHFQRLWSVQKGRCALCPDPLTRHAQIDHVVARSMGDADADLQLVCRDCHVGSH